MEQIKIVVKDMIHQCQDILSDDSSKTPNRNIIEVILREFQEISDYIEKYNQILLLNKKRQLWSIRTIIDSADYSYDNELFDQVRSFQNMCKELDEKFIAYKYNY